MGTRSKRFRRKLLLLAVLLPAAAGAYVAWHFQQGGTLEELEQQARETGGIVAARVETLGEGLSGPAEDADLDATSAARRSGTIEVFFAPANPNRPWELDDHLIDLIENAEESVLCAFYELELEAAAEALVAAHKRGRRVCIVSDTDYEKREAVQACLRAGVPVLFDERNAIMHNKFCVADGQRVWTGSTNVTRNGMYRNNNNALLLRSPELAENYTNEFAEMFERRQFGARSPRNTVHPAVSVGGITVECFFAPEDDVQEAIVRDIVRAKEHIDFMAFSFTSKEIAQAMAERVAAGVRVRGIFEGRQAGSQYSKDEFLAAKGAEIKMDRNKYNMHNKVIILDGSKVITGSYNFSKNANTRNDENALIIHDPEIAGRYTAEFESLFR